MNGHGDLLLLLINLSQMRSREKVIDLFLGSLGALFPPRTFRFAGDMPDGAPPGFPIATRTASYGYVVPTEGPPLSEQAQAALDNAIQMFAVILERLELERKLGEEGRSVERLAEDRLRELGSLVEELRDSRNAYINLVEDLTKEIETRRQVEAALRESEEKFRAIVNYTTDWESWFGTDGRHLWVNPAVKRFTGYSEEEILAMPDFISVLIAEEDRAILRSRFQEALAGSQGSDLEFRFLHKDGSKHWLSVCWQPIFDSQGKSLGVRASGRDITERKISDAYRELGLEILQILNGPGDLHDSIQRVLVALKVRTGFDAVGIRLQSGEDFPYFTQRGFPADFLLAENSLIDRDAGGGICRGVDGAVSLQCTCGMVISGTSDPANPFLTRGGSFWTNDSMPLLDIPPDEDPRLHPRNQCIHRGYASVALVPIRTKDRIVGLIQLNDRRKGRFSLDRIELLEGIASHIGTALMRKQAEEALRESREVLQAVLNSIPVRVFWKDRNLVFLGCNAPFARDAGFEKPEDIIGRSDDDMSWRAQADTYRADDRAVIASGEARLLFEEKNTTPSGREIHVLTSKVPLRDSQGTIVGILGAYQDITDRKHAEEERARLEAKLNQAAKMESVGRLAGGVAHDFNNKLQVILGSAEMLLDDVPVGGAVRAALEEIQTAARRSADLTRQLLAFSREQAISPVVLDLNKAIAGSLKMLGRLIGENIRLNFGVVPGLWPVYMDPSQFDQILANLAVNARDAIAGSGTLTIRAANRSLGEADCHDHPEFVPPGEYVVLTFGDDGAGMSPEVRAHIFEPFFTTKGVGKGTGLGLATVYGIIKQNNGAITVESEPGRGTTFTIHLPRSMNDSAASEEQVRQDMPRGTETVLVTEDESSVLSLVRKTLEQLGYTVLPAMSPRLALEICERHAGPIHLLLTDVIMPDMSGKVLADRTRSLRPGIRVLFMSGYTAEVMKQYGETPATLDLLQKPFSNFDLARRVREALNRDAGP